MKLTSSINPEEWNNPLLPFFLLPFYFFSSLSAGSPRNVRNVQHIVNRQICNIDLQRFRNLARLAADFDVPNNLFEHTSLLAHANRFSHKTQWHRRLDLFAFYQPLEVRVDQAHAHRIDLPVNEHNFTGPDAFNIDREDRVAPGIG